MKIFKISLILVIFLGLIISLSAQQNQDSAEKEFANYGTEEEVEDYGDDRTLGQTNSNRRNNNRNNSISGGRNNKNATPRRKKVGLRGVKISLEKQEKCRGDFYLVPTTSVFESGDCIRSKFMLNFAGYLTIINLGTSGKNKVIYPADDSNNKLKAKTDYFIPDIQGWEFDENPGNEQFIFIVSQKIIPKATIDKYLKERNTATENSDDFEVTTRDLKPRRENDSVYILVNAVKNEDPLVFRMTIKHR